MNQLHFSYSTLNMLINYSHCWINKVNKIKPEVKPYFTAGHIGHKIIQDHVAGRKIDDRIMYLTDTFPITESTSFDPACKFTIYVKGQPVIGYLDGDDPARKRFLEIKLSGTPWGINKFKQLMQRKIYAVAKPDYKEAVLITGALDPNLWKRQKLKSYRVPLTDKDREEAVAWMKEGIQVFEDGDFNRGLDEDGRCTDRWCPWGNNCHFKNI